MSERSFGIFSRNFNKIYQKIIVKSQGGIHPWCRKKWACYRLVTKFDHFSTIFKVAAFRPSRAIGFEKMGTCSRVRGP